MALQAGSAFSKYSLDITELSTNVNEAKNLLRDLQREAAKPIATPKVAAAAAVNGQAAANQQAQAKAVTASGSAAAKSDRQILSLAQAQARLAQVSGQGARAEQILADALSKVDQNTVKALRAQSQLLQIQNRLSNTKGPTVLPRTIDGLSGSALNLAKSYVTVQAAEKALDFAQTGAKSLELKTSFDNLAKSAGTTGQALLQSLRVAADGAIADAQLIQSANTGILLTQGKITNDLPKLVQIARASSKATGQDIGFVFDSLVRGIARGSPLIIDNAGITLNASKAFEDYAKSIGKSADSLTKEEQQQATLNAVTAAGADIIKQVGLDSNSAATQIDKAKVAISNLGDAIAQKIAPFAGNVASGIANTLNTGDVAPGTTQAGNQLQSKLVANAQDYDTYVQSVTKANDQVSAAFANDPIAGALARQLNGLSTLNPVQFQYAQSLIQTGTSQQLAFERASALADVTGVLSQQLSAAKQQGSAQQQAFQALIPTMAQAASISQENSDQVVALAGSLLTGENNAQQLKAALDGMIQANDLATAAAQAEARETNRLSHQWNLAIPAATGYANALRDIASASSLAAAVPKELSDTSGPSQSSIKSVQDAFKAHTQASSQFAADNKRIRDAQFNLDLQRAATTQQRIALLQSKLAKTTDKAERLNIQAQIESERRSRAGAGKSPIGADFKADLNLADDLSGKLALLRGKLSTLKEGSTAYKQVLAEIHDIEKKISAEKDKQLDAQLSASVSAIEDRKERRTETRQIDALQRRLANPNLQGERRQATQDELDLVLLKQQQRTRNLQGQIADAGGSLVTAIGAQTPAAQIGGLNPLLTPQAQGALAASNQALQVNLLLNDKEIASALIPSLQPLLSGAIRQSLNAGK